MFALEGAQQLSWLATMCAAVVLIGFVNFVVSFGLTLAVAIESRKVTGVDWRRELRSVGRLLLASPLRFLMPKAQRQAS